MRQLRDNEIVIALIAGMLANGGRIAGVGWNEADVATQAEAIVDEVIRRGDAAESQ